jgi:hypothetical protein
MTRIANSLDRQSVDEAGERAWGVYTLHITFRHAFVLNSLFGLHPSEKLTSGNANSRGRGTIPSIEFSRNFFN